MIVWEKSAHALSPKFYIPGDDADALLICRHVSPVDSNFAEQGAQRSPSSIS